MANYLFTYNLIDADPGERTDIIKYMEKMGFEKQDVGTTFLLKNESALSLDKINDRVRGFINTKDLTGDMHYILVEYSNYRSK